MGLDEVTQICPVPLPFWLSDSGGKGIQVCAVVHGEAQLAGRWGDYGRQIVLDTSSVKVFLPGITDTTTLQAASTLCGQASWKVRGQDHATRHDVATPDMIRQLPAGFALVIRGGCAPVIARLPRAWKNPAYRRARRLGHGPRRHRAARHPESDRARPPRLRARRVAPRRRHHLPLELTMTSNDPITAIVDQLAAHAEQLTRLDDPPGRPSRRGQRPAGRAHRPDRRPRPHVVEEHAAALRPGSPHPAQTRPGRPTATAPSRHRRGGSWRPPTARNPSPGCGPGSSRSTGPATATWPPPSAPAGPPTTCACTAWTSPPSCGRCCTCSPPAPPAWCRPRPSTRPASCPPWPTSSASRPTRCGHPAHPAPVRRPALEQAMTGATLRQALAFAARGWPVFPCQPGQKTPATRHGVRDATTDPEQITAWFGRHPDWNLAIATGAPGPDVLDVDQHGQAGNGYAAFRQLHDGRAARRGQRLRAHPQRRPARLLHRHRPAQRPPARPSPGLPLPRRLRPHPALPDRRQALPADQDAARSGALDWDAVTRHLQPQPQPHAPRTASPAARTSAAWPGGSPARPKATATPACSGPPTAPWTPTRPPTSAPWPPPPATPAWASAEITRTLESARNGGRTRTPAPDHQAEAGER